MDELIKNINLLWAGIIKRIEFNLLEHSIFIDVEVVEDGQIHNFSVVFENVSSYFFSNGEGNKRLQINSYDEGDYLELTSIHYFEKGIGRIRIESAKENWVNNWSASANFALEIWSSYLFIEAKNLSINGQKMI